MCDTSYLLNQELVGSRFPNVDVKHDAVLATGEEAVWRVPDERGLVDRPAVLSKLLRGAAHTGRTELCQPNLKTNIIYKKMKGNKSRSSTFKTSLT